MRIYNGDCLKIMPLLPAKSVDLIVIDPPYNIKKASWDCWKKQDDYINWLGSAFIECQRLLKDNGSFYFFHNDMVQIAQLVEWIRNKTHLLLKSMITIDKLDNNYIIDKYASQEHFRGYLNLAEYLLFYTFQDATGLTKVMSNPDNFGSIKKYLREEKQKTGLSAKEIEIILGTQMSGHYFGDSQWMLPVREQYERLQTTGYFQREYESLRQEYESLRYTFNKKDGLSNVWKYSFRKDVNVGHPTQKPLKLIEDIITYSSNEGDTILDCFAGSFTTGVACQNLGRHFIGIELDKQYYKIGKERMAMNKKLW